jgi:NMD protein affecting ribosome stability and mRNA decay
MAACLKCGAKVGCGCQLINGLCAACNAAKQESKKIIRNVIAKAYKLSRVC